MDQSERPIAFLSLARKYLGLSELCAREIERAHAWQKTPPGEETTWSVMEHGTPTLFTFFHGAELLLKGFVLAATGNTAKNHSLTASLAQFEKSIGNSDNRIGEFLAPYISSISPDSLLGRTLAENAIGIDKWYEFLRYPESNKGAAFEHWNLRRESLETRDFWQSLSRVARDLQPATVALAKRRGWYA